MIRAVSVIVASLVLTCLPVLAGERIVLATLEWPPYTGEKLPGQGACTEVVRAAFKAAGYELEVRFFPWTRVMQEARSDSGIVGYFPAYLGEWRAHGFHFSDRVGKSPLGLAQRTDVRLSWQSVVDLGRYTIGTVLGYGNTAEFDKLVHDGMIPVDLSTSDALNLRKVLGKRVDAAVIDAHVFDYLVHTDPVLAVERDTLTMHDRLLAVQDLVVCFPKTHEGERLLELFNEGLRQVPTEAIYRDCFNEDTFRR
jgi:polar amino acid transport system substrate-binding protein